MAELIGVISGAITFGSLVAQLAASIGKLKDYLEQIRDAPEDLKWLIRDIETFGLVLAEIEEDSGQESVAPSLTKSKSAMQSFKLCKEASEELNILVKDLRRDIDSPSRIQRSYAALKMTMQKNKLEKYRSRLKNVIGLLMLSQQCYTRALVQAQYELITKKVVSSEHDKSSDCRIQTLPLRERSRNGGFKWHLRVPPWMNTKMLEFAGERAPDGWKFAFRTFKEISIDSKAVQFASTGNIQGLQDLFASREASPFDRVRHNGYTLLHYVSGPQSEETFKFLLDQGADPSIGGNFRRPTTPLQYLVWSGSMNFSRPLLPSIRLLLSRSEVIVYDTPEETIDGLLSEFHGTSAEFKFLQQEFCPQYYQMPQSTRVLVAAQIASGVWDTAHMPELVRTVLGKDPLNIDNLQLECRSDNPLQKTTLVHSIAWKIGRSLANLHYNYSLTPTQVQNTSRNKKHLNIFVEADESKREQRLLYKSWNAMFCEMMRGGIDMHKIVSWATPFTSFLLGYFHRLVIMWKLAKACNTALKLWLEDLQACGLDLEMFGQNEEHLFRNQVVNRNLCRWINDYCPRLIGFAHGSSPEDWHLWISEGNNDFAGEFWSLVERQQDVMPGTWPGSVPFKI